MPTKLAQRIAKRKTGAESFRNGKQTLPFDLLSFWQWSNSDLLSNVTRGVLAEYIVARALGIGESDIRDEWAAYDLCTSDCIKIEVKCTPGQISAVGDLLNNDRFKTALLDKLQHRILKLSAGAQPAALVPGEFFFFHRFLP